ncbi:MAG: hypothetical protein LBG95_05050 [Treponema sp.]|jgi:RNA polymerase subunit RPABC4/transcription elongation factor Spt4|nr:hypothetical protein [Treponema sp.]
MGKTHRGKGIRELFARGRGTCPVCGATGIKVLYEQDAGGQKVKVCKPCKAAIRHGKKSVPTVQAASAAE